MSRRPPMVLVVAGNDPSGGAGIAADIQALAHIGVHAAPAISALTIQDTCGVRRVVPVDPELILEQVRCALDDLPIAVIKFGVLCETETIDALGAYLKSRKAIPIVLDPVLQAGSGDALTQDSTARTLIESLLPVSRVVTPNRAELRRLVPDASTHAAAANSLRQIGCGHVLVTGADESDGEVLNEWYGPEDASKIYHWPHLPHRYHGSGCTLASIIAGFLARGDTEQEAIEKAQATTWRMLDHGVKLGRGQWHPNRLPSERRDQD